MARVCVDACFLIGLYDKDDQHHLASTRHFSTLFGEESARHQLVAPWPILYECMGTRYSKQFHRPLLLQQHWNYLSEAGQLVLLDDGPYRDRSLSEHIGPQVRALSLVDRVLRAMILDESPHFDFFLTYNTADFADACRLGGVPLINEESTSESYGF